MEDLENQQKSQIQFLIVNLRRIFFVLSFLVGIFFLTGKQMLGESTFMIIANLLMPGYLLFVGLLIGDIVASFMIIKDVSTQEEINKIYIKFYMLGLIIGVVLGSLFMFM